MGGLKLSEIKKHVMTGISFMIPIVVGAGLCMALGTAIGGTKVSEAEGTLIWYIWRTGKIGMGFVVPVITAAIAYSIADRPAIAPGLILGSIASEIYTGFIGGIIAAFLVGYTVLFLKKYLKVPKTMQGLVPVLILPAVPDNADLRSPYVCCHRETGCLCHQCIAELADRTSGGIQIHPGSHSGRYVRC